MRLAADGLPAVLRSASFHGANTRAVFETEDAQIVALLPKGVEIPPEGSAVHLAWDAADLHLMTGAS
ncbi:TOBE domain-containing protein [Seohaeicola zhoushanensis]